MKIALLTDRAKAPFRASPGAAGYDVYACLQNPVSVPPLGRALIGTGFAMELPAGHLAYLASRSGLASKHGLFLLTSIIDSDYRGEVHVLLANHSDNDYTVCHGERIAQIVILRHESPDIEVIGLHKELSPTVRDKGGFGSTGKI